MGIWTSYTVRYSKQKRTYRFGNLNSFRPQVSGETPALLGTLGRAKLNHSKIKSEVKLSP
jgi:outer membrane lipoprotein SlyB